MNTSQELIHQLEQQFLHEVLPGLFGFHLLYICLGQKDYVTYSSPISHRTFVSQAGHQVERLVNVRSDVYHLPFASHSLDVVVAPHIFDGVEYPHELMTELSRVVVPGGHIVLFNYHVFNAWRLFGLQAPDKQRGINKLYMQDLLVAEHFTIEQSHDYFYRPPLRRAHLLTKLNWLERVGKYCWPPLASAYGIVAEKNLPNIRPLLADKRKKQRAKKQLVTNINRARS